MSYSDEEIKKYLEILNNYNKSMQKISPKAKCFSWPNIEYFTIDSGYKVCDECGAANGHVLGFYDVKDYDRLYYRKKSIYHRKYHYEKKVNQISKILNLKDEQKCELYYKLMKIDNHIMEILNKQYFRKRMISIIYLIKKILEEMVCENYKEINLKISSQTLEIYEKWWESYKGLKK